MGFTISHNLHRLRRAAVDPYIIKRNVLKLEYVIDAKVTRLCEVMEKYHAKGQPMNLTNALLATTMDIITEYSFADCYYLLESEQLSDKWRKTITCEGMCDRASQCFDVKKYELHVYNITIPQKESTNHSPTHCISGLPKSLQLAAIQHMRYVQLENQPSEGRNIYMGISPADVSSVKLFSSAAKSTFPTFPRLLASWIYLRYYSHSRSMPLGRREVFPSTGERPVACLGPLDCLFR